MDCRNILQITSPSLKGLYFEVFSLLKKRNRKTKPLNIILFYFGFGLNLRFQKSPSYVKMYTQLSDLLKQEKVKQSILPDTVVQSHRIVLFLIRSTYDYGLYSIVTSGTGHISKSVPGFTCLRGRVMYEGFISFLSVCIVKTSYKCLETVFVECLGSDISFPPIYIIR